MIQIFTYNSITVSSIDLFHSASTHQQFGIPIPKHLNGDLLHVGSVSPRLESSPARFISTDPCRPQPFSTADMFVMPNDPPAREDWVSDLATNVCMVCEVEQFSMVRITKMNVVFLLCSASINVMDMTIFFV